MKLRVPTLKVPRDPDGGGDRQLWRDIMSVKLESRTRVNRLKFTTMNEGYVSGESGPGELIYLFKRTETLWKCVNRSFPMVIDVPGEVTRLDRLVRAHHMREILIADVNRNRERIARFRTRHMLSMTFGSDTRDGNELAHLRWVFAVEMENYLRAKHMIDILGDVDLTREPAPALIQRMRADPALVASVSIMKPQLKLPGQKPDPDANTLLEGLRIAASAMGAANEARNAVQELRSGSLAFWL